MKHYYPRPPPRRLSDLIQSHVISSFCRLVIHHGDPPEHDEQKDLFHSRAASEAAVRILPLASPLLTSSPTLGSTNEEVLEACSRFVKEVATIRARL